MAVTTKKQKKERDKGSSKEVAKKNSRKEVVKKAAPAKPSRIEQARTFFRGVVNELKKVHWPTRRETAIYTTVVVVSVAFVAILIWIFDIVLGSVMSVFIK